MGVKDEVTDISARNPLKTFNIETVQTNSMRQKNIYDADGIENSSRVHQKVTKEMSGKKLTGKSDKMLFIPPRNHEKPYDRRLKLRETTLRPFKFTCSDKNSKIGSLPTQKKISSVDKSSNHRDSDKIEIDDVSTNSLLKKSKNNEKSTIKKQTQPRLSSKSSNMKNSSKKSSLSQPSEDQLDLKNTEEQEACTADGLNLMREITQKTRGSPWKALRTNPLREFTPTITKRDREIRGLSEKSVEKDVELDFPFTSKRNLSLSVAAGFTNVEKSSQEQIHKVDSTRDLLQKDSTDRQVSTESSDRTTNQEDSSEIRLWGRNKGLSSSADLLDLDVVLHWINHRIEIVKQHQVVKDDGILTTFQDKVNQRFANEINNVLEDNSRDEKYQIANRWKELMEGVQKMDFENEKLEWQLAQKKKLLAEQQEKRRKTEEINSYLFDWFELKKKFKK